MARKALTFNFCGKFTGKDTSGPRWIKAFEHELEDFKQEGIVPAELYLKYLDLLLTEDAAGWLETNADASNLIYTPHPTQDTVEQVTSLLKERFPSKVVEAAPISFDAELSELKQRVAEPKGSATRCLSSESSASVMAQLAPS